MQKNFKNYSQGINGIVSKSESKGLTTTKFNFLTQVVYRYVYMYLLFALTNETCYKTQNRHRNKMKQNRTVHV